MNAAKLSLDVLTFPRENLQPLYMDSSFLQVFLLQAKTTSETEEMEGETLNRKPGTKVESQGVKDAKGLILSWKRSLWEFG